MAETEPKIITKLLERRQIEAGFERLLEASSPIELQRQAAEIAAHGSQVLPVIIAHLDGASAAMVQAMGQVAALLDREQAVRALREAVLHGRLSDQARLAAIEILQRWLEWPTDDELIDQVRDPRRVVLAALEQLVQRGEHDVEALVEYIEGLDRQPPDVVLSVVATVGRMAHERGDPVTVDLLRMMALDVREEIGAAAIDALGSIRRPAAAWALQALLPGTPPALSDRAERLLRKLRFRGVQVEPLRRVEPGWRALVSPPSASGQQNLWFIMETRGTGYACFMSVLLHDQAGAVEASAHEWVPLRLLLPRRPVGHMHDVPFPDGSGSLLLAEVSFDVGRRLLLDALPINAETQIPLAGTLRLRSPWLWEVSGGCSLPPRGWPEPAAGGDTTRLLAHPALAGWGVGGHALLDFTSNPPGRRGWTVDVYEQRVIDEVVTDSTTSALISARLRSMGGWLLLAGDESSAALAMAAAQGMVTAPREEPFLRALVRRDLETALRGMARS